MKRVNDLKVRNVRVSNPAGTLPVKGKAIYPDVYANCFILAKKKSGKTVTIHSMIKELALPKHTTVLAFSNTVDRDPVWLEIQDMCERKKIAFQGYNSLTQDGVNVLEVFMQEMDPDNSGDLELDNEEEKAVLPKPFEESKKKRKPPAPKYQFPKFLMVFDDLSDELKNKTFIKFTKVHRHYKVFSIISNQYLNDVPPSVRKQMDLWLVFKGQPLDKLEVIHKDGDSTLPLDEFEELYKDATEEKFHFFYFDCRREEYRKDFSYKYELNEE